MACPLGRLYNKDALLEYLLAPASAELPLSATPFGADGLATAGHIRSLKDVTELKLTPNPSATTGNSSGRATRAGEADASVGAARFICPLSQRPMNGATRFVFFEHCGNVVSEAGLKELRGALKKGKKRSPPVEEQQQQQQPQSQPEPSTLEPCSVCGGSYAPDEPELGHIINPVDPEELANLKVRWEAKKAAQKTSKKAKKDVSKKRKASTADPDAAGDTEAKEEKRAKKEAALASAHVLGESAPSGAPRLPASMVAALEAKRDQLSKTAVADLYAKHDPNKKEDWMVRGTFKSRV